LTPHHHRRNVVRLPFAIPVAVIVAGIPGEEATVKTLRRTGEQIVLEPANAALSPMVFSPDEVQVYGVVVTVMRKL
jgi:repressor LexA